MLQTVFFPQCCTGSPPGILIGTSNADNATIYIVAVVHFPVTPKDLNAYLVSHCRKNPPTNANAMLKPVGTWFPVESWESEDKDFKNLIPNLFSQEQWLSIKAAKGENEMASFFVQHVKKSLRRTDDIFAGSNFDVTKSDTIVVLYNQAEVWDGELYDRTSLLKSGSSAGDSIEGLFAVTKSCKKTILNYESGMDPDSKIRITHCCVKRELSLVYFLLSIFANFVLMGLSAVSAAGHSFWKKAPTVMTAVFSFLGRCMEFSSFCAHVKKRFEDFNNSLMALFHNGGKDKKMGYHNHNVIACVLADILLGIMFLWTLQSYDLIWSNKSTKDVFLPYVDTIAKQVEELIEWIMGIPAGLKLNHPLNQFLGRFFLYHVRLWLEYSKMMMDFFPDLIRYCLMSSCMGLSFFLSVTVDAVSTLSFHVYCFYVYAGRLYGMQVSGLMSMWRLFRGKKWNPLRKRVDSLEESGQSADQLFAGTLLFTVLLFLLPTTAMYYAIFMLLRVAVLAVQVMLSSLVFAFSEFPWYSFLLRVTRPHRFIKSMRMAWLSPDVYSSQSDDGNSTAWVGTTTDHEHEQALSVFLRVAAVPISSVVVSDLSGRRSGRESTGVRTFLRKIIVGDLVRWS